MLSPLSSNSLDGKPEKHLKCGCQRASGSTSSGSPVDGTNFAPTAVLIQLVLAKLSVGLI